LQEISGAVFFEMEQKKSELREAGRSVIDLGIGPPDKPPARLADPHRIASRPASPPASFASRPP